METDTPPETPNKRKRGDDDAGEAGTSQQPNAEQGLIPRDVEMAVDISGTGASGMGGGQPFNVALFKIGQCHKYLNSYKMTFTKTFQFWFQNAVWNSINPDSEVNRNHIRSPYFQWVWDKISNYMSPSEWQDCRFHHRYGKILKVANQMELRSHIPFYKTGSTEQQIASPQNVNYLSFFKDMEQITPHITRYLQDGSIDGIGDPLTSTAFAQWRTRLYGAPFANAETNKTEFGATDVPRRYPFVPVIVQNNAATAKGPQHPGRWMSSINLFGHRCKQIPTTQIGGIFSFTHKPKNGIFDFAPSVVSNAYNENSSAYVQWNQKRKNRYTLNTAGDYEAYAEYTATPSDENAFFNGIGNAPDEYAYNAGSIENYSVHTSRNDPPIHHLSSIWFGVDPQFDVLGKPIEGQTFIEVKTMMDIDFQQGHAINQNWATNQNFTFTNFQQCRNFQTNDTDLLLHDHKIWLNSYHIGGKPIFSPADYTTPQFSTNRLVANQINK